jgi:tRNA 2-thiouridine synthesizing protein A
MSRVELDLRGEVCPYTFVRTKLAIEELADGDELSLRLDHRPAFDNIPRSLREDGHDVIAIEYSSDRRECIVTARCRVAPAPGPLS